MATPRDLFRDDSLIDRVIPSRWRIPSDPAPGNYVVVDVTHFSTTVVELLRRGAEYVHVTEERGDEFDFQADHPRALIGGGSGPEYEPTDGYDFFNSPSYVQSVDVVGRPTAMTSTNGGAAVTDLKGAEGATVYVGSTTNAAALGAHLRQRDEPTYVVAAGSKRKPAPEDVVGALLVRRHVENDPPSAAELATFETIVTAAKGRKYREKDEVRQRDLLEYCTEFDCRSVVPKLDGDRLVDVAE